MKEFLVTLGIAAIFGLFGFAITAAGTKDTNAAILIGLVVGFLAIAIQVGMNWELNRKE